MFRCAALSSMFVCGVTVFCAVAQSVELSGDPVDIGRYRQLFVDDTVIERMDNLKKVMNRPKKYPDNPVLVGDQPWEGEQLILYGAVIYDEDEKLFKMWYWCRRGGAYATSQDGIHWEKPEVGLIEFEGSKQNNLVPWGAMGMIHSPDDGDPGKRYKSIHGRRGAFSSDGLTFTYRPKSRDIPGDIISDNVIPFFYDESRRRYVAFPKVNRLSGGHLRRAVSVSFSNDFLTWTPVETILVPDERDDELARETIAAMPDHVEYDDGAQWHLAQFYGHCGFPYEGMYLGLLWVFDISGWGAPIWGEKDFARLPGIGGEDGLIYVQLTSSRDLVHWERVGDRRPFIPLGAAGSYDAGMIYTINRPIIVGDEIRIYYSGSECGHGHPNYWSTETDRFPQITQAIKQTSLHTAETINLATLRLDGWVSVDAGAEEGVLTSRPLRFEGRQLVLNVVAKGRASVEILDDAGTTIKGFRADDCDSFSGDAIRHVVRWRGSSDVSELTGKPVRLRFRLRDAKLYSFAIE